MVPAPFLVTVTVAWLHTTAVAWRESENEMVRCPAPAPATVAWPVKKPVAWTGTRTVPWRDEVWAAEPGGATVDSEESEMVQWLALATADWPRRKREAWLMKQASSSHLARLPVPAWKDDVKAGTACRGEGTAARRHRLEANPALQPENHRRQRREEARQGEGRCGCCSSPRGGACGASGASGGSAAICLRQQRQESTGAPWKRPSSAMAPGDDATAAACLSPPAYCI